MKYIALAIFVYIALAVTLGVHCVDYAIWAITGQDLSLIADFALAIFFGGFFVPAAILLWAAGMLNLTLPLISG